MSNYGLLCKDPARWEDGTKVLGLQLWVNNSVVQMSRGGDWCVNYREMNMWVDTSSVVTAVLLEVNRNVIGASRDASG